MSPNLVAVVVVAVSAVIENNIETAFVLIYKCQIAGQSTYREMLFYRIVPSN